MNKILIVDDEQPLRKIMNDQFTKEKFEVITAQDGADGLGAALKNHPDLIVLDITMPVMDGFTMLKKLRQDKWGSKVPVMILTNRDDSANISAMMNNKINKYYIKADNKLDDIAKEIKDMLPVIQRTYPN
jgi:DNA-binding response OmpR family regulator